jgi:polyhydroxyalkanoate synthesis regulator phasin
MIEDMRKYVRAGLDALSSQGAEDAAGVIMSRATVLADQLNAFASGFLEWSAEARASLMQELKDMITRQVDSMGLATKEDLQALGRRIDRLERASKSKEPAGASKSKASAGATKSKGSTGSSKAKATARARRPKTTSRSGGSRRSTSE